MELERFSAFILFVSLLFGFSDCQSVEDEVNVGLENCGNAQLRETRDSGTLVFPPTGVAEYDHACEWVMTIDSGDANSHLTLEFKSFGLGAGDTLRITDIQFGGGYDVEYDDVNRPTGDAIDAFKDKAQIYFKSDSDPSTTGLGVRISWTSSVLVITTQPGLPRETVFRTVLGNADYSLTTPNYPGNYPAAKTLYWVLTAAEGDRIQMDFESFDLSLDDSVSIYEGIEEDINNRLTYVDGSTNSVHRPVISKTNQVLIIFVSSPYVTKTGFEITYYVYVYKAPSTTLAPKQTPKPLTPSARAVVIVVCVLLLLVAVIVCIYVFYFRPKQRAEEQQIARELYDNGVDINKGEEPQRPMTDAQAARIRAAALMRSDYGMNGGRQNGSPITRPGTASQRPTTAAQRVGSAAQRPTTVIARPGTASQRPGTAGQRPGTAGQRPGIAGQRPGTAGLRPGTASQRNGAPPASMSWSNEQPDDLTNTSTHMSRADSGWGQSIEDTSISKPRVNISTTSQSGLYQSGQGSSATTPTSYETLSTPHSRKDALPPLELNAEPVKVKKKKKKRAKPDLDSPADDLGDLALPSLSARSTASGEGSKPGTARPGSGRPGSARPGSARPGSGLHTSATAPDLAVTKLPGQVVRHDDDDGDDWSL